MASSRFRFVAEISVRVDAAGTEQTFIFATSGFTTLPTDTPANTTASARLLDPGTVQRDLFTGARVAGGSRPAFGQMVLLNADGALDVWLEYGTGNGRVTVRYGAEGAAYPAGYATVYVARISSVQADLAHLRLVLRDRSYLLDRPVLTATFAGTGGAEGEQAGIRKQIVMGDPGLVPLIPVEPELGIYFVQANAAPAAWANGVAAGRAALYDAGVAVSQGLRVGSYAALRSSSSGANAWDMYADAGLTAEQLAEVADRPRTDVVGPVYIRYRPLDDLQRGELRMRCAGRLKDSASDTLRTWRFSDLLRRAGMADVTPATLAGGSTDFDLGSRLVEGDQTYAELLNDAARAELLAWGINRLDQPYALRLKDPADTTDPADVVRYRFTKHNAGNFRRVPVPGMENPVHQVLVNAGRTWPCQVADAAGTDARRELQRQWPYTAFSATAASVLTAHPGAEVATVDVQGRYFITKAQQQAFGARFIGLFGGRRDCIILTVEESAVRGDFATLLGLELHDKVELEHERFRCTPARVFRLISIQLNLQARQITFTLWGGAAGPSAEGEVVIADAGNPPGTAGGGSRPGGSPLVPTGSEVLVLGRMLMPPFTLQAVAGFEPPPARMRRTVAPFALRSQATITRANAAFADVVLQLHGDGIDGSTTIVDSSSYAHTCTAAGNAQISTDISSMFGGAAIKFDGSGDVVDIPDHAAFDVGAGDFCIEWAIYWTGSGTQTVINKMSSTWGLQYEWSVDISADSCNFYYGIRGTNQAVIVLYWPRTLATNTREVCAIQRVQGQWSCFLGGQKGTQYAKAPLGVSLVFGPVTTGVHVDAVDLGSTTNPIKVGRNFFGFDLSGYLEELRFTKRALYTGPSYLPATEPFPDL